MLRLIKYVSLCLLGVNKDYMYYHDRYNDSFINHYLATSHTKPTEAGSGSEESD